MDSATRAARADLSPAMRRARGMVRDCDVRRVDGFTPDLPCYWAVYAPRGGRGWLPRRTMEALLRRQVIVVAPHPPGSLLGAPVRLAEPDRGRTNGVRALPVVK